MGTIINIYDAKTNLSKYVERAAKGEEIWIGKYGKPLVKMVRIPPPSKKARRPGALKGKIWMADDFDEPMMWLWGDEHKISK